MPENVWKEENIELFHQIRKTIVAEQNREIPEVVLSKGECVYEQGQSAERIYLLLGGRIKIGSISNETREIIKDILKPGAVFGEEVLAGLDKYRNFARAIDPSTKVYTLNIHQFRSAIQMSPNFVFRALQQVSRRHQRIELRLENLIRKDARTRIVEFLIELGQEHGQPVGDETLIYNFLTHRDIANATATSRQTVTSILNDLRTDNLIYFDRKRMLIRDISQLQRAVIE